MTFATLTMGTRHDTQPPPPAHQAGDWLYMWVETTSGNVPAPAGWSLRSSIAAAAGTTSQFLFRRYVPDATPIGTPTITGGTNHTTGVIGRVRGAHATDPDYGHGMAYATAAVTTAFAPGMLSRYADSLVIQSASWALDNAGPMATGWANASLANVVEAFDEGTTTGDGGGVTIMTGEMAAADTVVLPGTATVSSGMITGITFAIRPADPAPAFTGGPFPVEDFDGNPAPDGGTVYVLDITLGVIETSAVIAGGEYTVPVKHNDADRYRSFYDNGADPPGVSVPWTAT